MAVVERFRTKPDSCYETDDSEERFSAKPFRVYSFVSIVEFNGNPIIIIMSGLVSCLRYVICFYHVRLSLTSLQQIASNTGSVSKGN